MLHGTTTMPSVRNEPLEIAAPSGDRRALIAKRVIARREILDLFDCMLGFMDQRTGGPLAHHHVGLDA